MSSLNPRRSQFDMDSDEDEDTRVSQQKPTAPGASTFSDDEDEDRDGVHHHDDDSDMDGAQEIELDARSVSITDSPARSPLEVTNFAAILRERERERAGRHLFVDQAGEDTPSEVSIDHSVDPSEHSEEPDSPSKPKIDLTGAFLNFSGRGGDMSVPAASASARAPVLRPEAHMAHAVDSDIEAVTDDDDEGGSDADGQSISLASPTAHAGFNHAAESQAQATRPLDLSNSFMNFRSRGGEQQQDSRSDNEDTQSISLDSPASPAFMSSLRSPAALVPAARAPPPPHSGQSGAQFSDDDDDDNTHVRNHIANDDDDDDDDRSDYDASSVNIHLDSPPITAVPPKAAAANRESLKSAYSVSDQTSDTDGRSIYTDNVDTGSVYTDEHEVDLRDTDSPVSSIAPSLSAAPLGNLGKTVSLLEKHDLFGKDKDKEKEKHSDRELHIEPHATPAVIPASTPIPASVPIPVPASTTTPVVPASVPISVPIPVPEPATTPTPAMPISVPVSAPIPMPVPVPSSVPALGASSSSATTIARGMPVNSPSTPTAVTSPIPQSATSATSSVYSYPPGPHLHSRSSIMSTSSGTSNISTSTSATSKSNSKKARPESMLMLGGAQAQGPLVLGLALVDFNHIEGPKIEFSEGSVCDDEEVAKILPFLSLPDGAHMSSEDFSYFHLVPSSPNPQTVFGISCNRQIPASELLVKDADVTRSTVQKAVVVLASTPIFGLIRDRLGVITQALFAQRDFTDKSILTDFYESLEIGLRSQLTESGLYMGTSLRELVHTFRQRTLVLIKALMLQKRIMFAGHPVERLCTYQYSLISLIPGLLQALQDCGSPPLATRAPSLKRPSELRTSDRRSMMAYTGLPLDIFGRDAMFQPYLPLQQLDMMKETKSWLCGSTNSIVTQSKEIDLLVNLETGIFEFRNPGLERVAGLTAADRKWMDEIVQDVNESWDDTDKTGGSSVSFKGSDDYLRVKFDEYISAALASIKYADFIAKGEGNGVTISGSGGNENTVQDFNPLWMADFRTTNAYEVWNRITDPVLFDLVEPRHPCGTKPTVVSDIGLRLSEGIQDLKLDQQLAPAREAVSSVIAAGSSNVFKAVEGIRGRWQASRQSISSSAAFNPPSGSNSSSASGLSAPVEITRSEAELSPSQSQAPRAPALGGLDAVVGTGIGVSPRPTPVRSPSGAPASPARPISIVATDTVANAGTALTSFGANVGSFFSSRWGRSPSPQPPQTNQLPLPPAPYPRPLSLLGKSLPAEPANSGAGGPPEPPTPTSRNPQIQGQGQGQSLPSGAGLGISGSGTNKSTDAMLTPGTQLEFQPRNLDEEQHNRNRERHRADNASVIGFPI